MNIEKHFYKGKVSLNVLAGSINNAIECYEAAEEKVLVGILSKKYPSTESAIEDMSKYAKEIDNAISVGLGAGDPNQWAMVSAISKVIKPKHANQVFTAVGHTRANVDNSHTLINCLVSPSGTPGEVIINTGPLSSQKEKGIVPIETAIAMIKDMGGSSIKFFPMGGLKTEEEFRVVAKACAKEDLYLEPTGGIDLDNFEPILRIALEAGVKKIIPHVYSSIIDKESGETRVEDVKTLLAIVKKVVDEYER